MRAPIFLYLILPVLGYCESDQTALAILERTAKAYRDVGSYQIEVRSLYTLDDAGQTKVSESRIVAAGAGPGKYRWEVFGTNPASSPRELRISDGLEPLGLSGRRRSIQRCGGRATVAAYFAAADRPECFQRRHRA